MDNAINMSVPEGTAFTVNSAGIEMKGFTQGSSVLSNRIRGRAGAAFVMVDQNKGMPVSSSFVSNDLTDFQSSLGDVFVDAGATDTFVLGRPVSMKDNGIGTVVATMR